MIKYSSLFAMVGRYYPFFLNNGSLNSAHYLYAIDSPGINQTTGTPMFTLRKISERSNRKENTLGNDIDILNYCYGNGRYSVNNKAPQIVKDLMRKKNPVVTMVGNNFPYIDVQNLSLPKSLVINLRGIVRNRFYKFNPGRFIDILWTPTEFAVFKLVGNAKDGVSLAPVAVYKNSDIGMIDPLPVDVETLDYNKNKFVIGQDGKSMSLSLAIKEMEWTSFDRKSFVK